MIENTIHTRLVKIGNSQGVRLPKTLLEIAKIKDQIDLSIEDGTIIIRASEENKVRLNWAKSFQEMASENDDQLLDSDTQTLSYWDEQEWEW
ncbi:AbrB/MazE/SpoVT family DNA-binding domain-containing protein [Cyanobacterium aponinum]|uniref:SpoVT/AbrB domain-containing protein n=1 Tax=Cyanobacterium aponinum (strain PCC 10605) TaxID=755178 RepID=K9Z3J8_CYAAP|nr:AbrB/MazE/SpoVT family DNA-binding domain-containing protein [Cyanobacterium aponinum]AFZ53312.1 SpoVT/AbrB domain-containing protein [Cyanobacterium aponinum PCC 10605]